MNHFVTGVNCAAATPVTTEGEPDYDRFITHCKNLLNAGCHGIAPLGTTGEANSFGLTQRKKLLDSLIDADIASDVLLPGTSTPAIADTIELTRHAVNAGVKACVMLPPYYYKGVSDEGLYRFYANVIDGLGDDRLRVVLYHIPQVTQIPISHDLIERLLQDYPGIVCAIKDSAGQLENMQTMCERFPELAVLAGADPLMLPLLKSGGAGCITATTNLRADAMRLVWDNWENPERAPEVDATQSRINAWRDLSNRYLQLSTVKSMLAKHYNDATWMYPKPPLLPLSQEQQDDIWSTMDQLDTADQGNFD